VIDSIFVALSGMQGHERGLNVISNNISNMNTPAFRGSTVSFADVLGGAPQDRPGRPGARGGGLDASRTMRDMRRGEPQQTGNPLDLFLQGDGFFVLQDTDGAIRYSRNGRFNFKDGVLVDSSQAFRVMARNAAGQLVPVDLKNLRISPSKPTTEVSFDGNLSPETPTTTGGSGSGERTKTIDALAVFDTLGTKHTLAVKFSRDATSPSSGASVTWKVTVSEGGRDIGAAELRFDGPLVSGSRKLNLTLALSGTDPADVTFDFNTVLGQDLGTTAQSSLNVQKQDGFGLGTVTAQTFDEKGILKLTYSNGQTADGPRLVTAQILDDGGLQDAGGSMFTYRGTQAVLLREPGDDLKLVSKSLELSNVDLTQEFGQLILMQRGYQASSQVLSTANDMLQELLQMKSGK